MSAGGGFNPPTFGNGAHYSRILLELMDLEPPGGGLRWHKHTNSYMLFCCCRNSAQTLKLCNKRKPTRVHVGPHQNSRKSRERAKWAYHNCIPNSCCCRYYSCCRMHTRAKSLHVSASMCPFPIVHKEECAKFHRVLYLRVVGVRCVCQRSNDAPCMLLSSCFRKKGERLSGASCKGPIVTQNLSRVAPISGSNARIWRETVRTPPACTSVAVLSFVCELDQTKTMDFRVTHTPEAKASDDFVRPAAAAMLAEAAGDIPCSRREPVLGRNTPFNMSLEGNIVLSVGSSAPLCVD